MKNIISWAVLAGLAVAGAACSKVDVEAPTFDASVAKTTFAVGERVPFNLTGKADNVTFYSGEAGRSYDNRDIYTKAGGVPEMQFLTTIAGGTATIGSQNLRVLVSTNFSGKLNGSSTGYDSTEVRKATWTDVTSRVALTATATNLSSGVISLSDLKVEGQLMYVAFRYVGTPPLSNAQRTVTIGSFQFRTRYPDGTLYTNAGTNADVGFSVTDFKNATTTWVSGATLVHAGAAANATPADDDWAISTGFDLTRYLPDNAGGLPVKAGGLPDVVPAVYTYTYTRAGTYTATFLAQTGNADERKNVVKQLTLTVQ
jgi:hypothetical protein